MRPQTVLLLAAIIAGSVAPTAAAAQREATDRGRWLDLRQRGFPVAEGTRAVDLLVEMNPLLGSPDHVLRDEVAYSAAERWILRERRLDASDLRTVRNLWLENLRDGLGSRGDDRVFKRSFSALCLSLVAAADLADPFMGREEFNRFLDRTLEYFDGERDLRGFDAALGWMHTVAHTADLLKFLARNPKLDEAAAARIVAAISRKLRAAEAVFQWGEPDRLALALVPIARSQPAFFDAWVRPWADEHRRLWAKGPQVDPRQFALLENVKQTLRSVYASLQIAASQSATAWPALVEQANAVLAALAAMR